MVLVLIFGLILRNLPKFFGSSLLQPLHHVSKVVNLIDQSMLDCNHTLRHHLFSNHQAASTFSIPMALSSMQDILVLCYVRDVQYSVHSGYKFLLSHTSGTASNPLSSIFVS